MWQLPEHLIEDILELILFLTNHHPQTLGTSQLYPLMTMVRKRDDCPMNSMGRCEMEGKTIECLLHGLLLSLSQVAEEEKNIE